MIDRREFVTTGLLLAGASTLSTPVLASPAADIGIPNPELFIYDSRYPQARELAKTMGAAGVKLIAIEGDFTPVWSATVQPLWKQRPMVVAGMTTERALFVLQTLAADYRMKLFQSHVMELVGGSEPLHQWLLVPRAPKQQ